MGLCMHSVIDFLHRPTIIYDMIGMIPHLLSLFYGFYIIWKHSQVFRSAIRWGVEDFCYIFLSISMVANFLFLYNLIGYYRDGGTSLIGEINHANWMIAHSLSGLSILFLHFLINHFINITVKKKVKKNEGRGANIFKLVA